MKSKMAMAIDPKYFRFARQHVDKGVFSTDITIYNITEAIEFTIASKSDKILFSANQSRIGTLSD